MLDEGLLQRVHPVRRAEALNGGDVGPVERQRELEAGIHTFAVDQYRAGAALAMVTALFRAGQFEIAAEQIEQGLPGMDIEIVRGAVDRQGQGTGGEARACGSDVHRFCLSLQG